MVLYAILGPTVSTNLVTHGSSDSPNVSPDIAGMTSPIRISMTPVAPTSPVALTQFSSLANTATIRIAMLSISSFPGNRSWFNCCAFVTQIKGKAFQDGRQEYVHL